MTQTLKTILISNKNLKKLVITNLQLYYGIKYNNTEYGC